jgi:hypothetical protein
MESKWFVRANRGKTELNMPCHMQRATEVHIGPINKVIEHKSARDVAYSCKEKLIAEGWENVRVVRVDPS